MTAVQVQTQIPDRDELMRLVPHQSFRLVKFFENMAKDVSTTLPAAIGESLQGPTGGVGDRDVVIFDGTSGFAVKDSGIPIDALAPLASPHFTGVPTAPTAAPGTLTTQIATTAFVTGATSGFVKGPASSVNSAIALFNGVTGAQIKDSTVLLSSLAPVASPALTGNPTAPTQSLGDNDTSIATTAFVQSAISNLSASAAYFSAHNNGFSQSIPSGAFTTLFQGAVLFNVGGFYNNIANTWTPPAGRLVQLSGAVTINTTAGTLVAVAIFKNGAVFKRGVMTLGSGSNSNTVTVQCIDLPSGTDVYDLRVSQSSGVNQSTFGAAESTYFQGTTIQA